jgi:hypothetical protein
MYTTYRFPQEKNTKINVIEQSKQGHDTNTIIHYV